MTTVVLGHHHTLERLRRLRLLTNMFSTTKTGSLATTTPWG